MSQYSLTQAQLRYLAKKHAEEKEQRSGCDCAGGESCPRTEKPCKGHVVDCSCDVPTKLGALKDEIRKKKEFDAQECQF